MKPQSPRELIEKTRRVYHQPPAEPIPLPPGFVNRVVDGQTEPPGPQRQLLLWERVSYAGVAVAACLSLAVWLGTAETEIEPGGNAADLWLNMPMNESF